jgi:hypothetical protein
MTAAVERARGEEEESAESGSTAPGWDDECPEADDDRRVDEQSLIDRDTGRRRKGALEGRGRG